MPVPTARNFLITALVLLGTGCQPVAETRLAAYLQALDDITGTTSVVGTGATLPTYPSRRERRLPMPALRIGLGELFDLYGCRLFFLVNERNSIMGRVMPISQRLIYELRFLRAAGQCRARLADTDQTAIIQRLDGTIAHKRELLPTLFWNATFDSPEMARAFSLAVSPLEPGEEAGFSASRKALAYFLTLGEEPEAPDLRIDSSILESHYQALAAHRYGGRLATTLALASDYLAAANTALAQRPDCPGSIPAARWRALQTALAPLRELMDTLQRQGDRWLETVNRLIELPGIEPPPAFRDYHAAMLDRDGGLWQRFRTTLRRHRAYQHRWVRACAPAQLRQALRF